MYPQEPDNLVRVRKIRQTIAAAISFDGGVKGQCALSKIRGGGTERDLLISLRAKKGPEQSGRLPTSLQSKGLSRVLFSTTV